MPRIGCGDIVQGRPLTFDCFDAGGTLLLRRGQVIASEKQLNALIERGLFTQVAQAKPARDAATQDDKRTPFSMMDTCKDRVRALFANLKASCGADLPAHVSFDELALAYRETVRHLNGRKPVDFPEQILNVCKGIQVLCKVDEDAAIGAIHLDAICRYTTMHAIHQAVLSELVASRLGMSAQERLPILAAALTANISIINLQEALHVQNRKPTDAERELLRLHPQLSIEMLLELGVRDEVWMQAILQHHEKPDGSGYPCGLKRGAIARGAQILGLADIYGTMVRPRPYREALPGKEVLRQLFMKRGVLVDDALVQIFIKTMGIYPPGSFVRLENGETAIVTRRGKSPATPQVKSVRDALGMPLAYSSLRDTTQRPFAICVGIPRDQRMTINLHSLWDYGWAN